MAGIKLTTIVYIVGVLAQWLACLLASAVVMARFLIQVDFNKLSGQPTTEVSGKAVGNKGGGHDICYIVH